MGPAPIGQAGTTPPHVKICGLRTSASLDAAMEAGADMVGFVRFAPSPRHVDLATARLLSDRARGRVGRVLLMVDPTDQDLDAVAAAVAPDLLQLHGRESPERIARIRFRTGVPVMKAVGIATGRDLALLGEYADVADHLLVDAKPSLGAALPGGNGVAFDWSLLAGLDASRGIMLSGGLDPDNVARAIGLTGVRAVDVSSGVESRLGEKDPDRIAAFVAAARAAFAAADLRSVA